jgi:hypothetical protein
MEPTLKITGNGAGIDGKNALSAFRNKILKYPVHPGRTWDPVFIGIILSIISFT